MIFFGRGDRRDGDGGLSRGKWERRRRQWWWSTAEFSIVVTVVILVIVKQVELSLGDLSLREPADGHGDQAINRCAPDDEGAQAGDDG